MGKKNTKTAVLEERKKTYIAGPMTSLTFFNYVAFWDAAFELEDAGYEVFNPAEHDTKMGFKPTCFETGDINNPTCGYHYPGDTEHKFDIREALAWDTARVCESDFVTLLPGWESSSGVRAELAPAFAITCPVFKYEYDNVKITLTQLTEDEWKDSLAKYSGGARTAVSDPLAGLHANADLPLPSGEVRTTSSTGGQKGVKPQRYDLVPVGPLAELAELYARGASKYEKNNWRKGYEWSNSYAAAMRHLTQFWNGEDHDPETGSKHVMNVAFHMFALAEFMDRYPEFDDRYKP